MLLLRARSIKTLSDNFHNYYALLTLTTNKIVMIHLTSTQMVVRMRKVLAIRGVNRGVGTCASVLIIGIVIAQKRLLSLVNSKSLDI